LGRKDCCPIVTFAAGSSLLAAHLRWPHIFAGRHIFAGIFLKPKLTALGCIGFMVSRATIGIFFDGPFHLFAAIGIF